MTTPKPQTIYSKLFDKVIAAAHKASTNLDRSNNLLVRSLYADAEKLRSADFDQGTHVLAALDCECGDFDAFLQKANLLLQRNPGNIVYIDLLIKAAHSRLRPSFASNVLDLYTEKPNMCMSEDAPLLMNIGAYKHFLKADAVMQKANIAPIYKSIHQHDLSVAKAMERLDMSEATLSAIIEQAGKVLAAHGLKWHGTAPHFTVQNAEIGAWYNIDISPEKAAQLDDELSLALIDAGLDAEPFFVSFVGVGA